MFNALRFLGHILLVPLCFFPAPIQGFLISAITFFSLFLVGKLFRWLWDLIPIF